MKIIMITGSYPPDSCGVGDYTFNLLKYFEKDKFNIELFYTNNWKINNLVKIILKLLKINPDIIHIQYPTVGYGYALIPQILAMVFCSVVTIHEFSAAHLLRKLSIYPFFIFARKIIFTSNYELIYANKWCPCLKKKSTSISIGSNISIGKRQKKQEKKEIISFGLIRPNKGMEELLQLAALIRDKNLSYQVNIIGKIDSRSTIYFENLQKKAENLPLIWTIGLEEKEVADKLANSLIGYLPFPDGASERRGSLLALLNNGVVTITTRGQYTPVMLEKDVVQFAENPKIALEMILSLAEDKIRINLLRKNGKIYCKNFTWDVIADQHSKLYKQIISE